jgi:hypothetical protein
MPGNQIDLAKLFGAVTQNLAKNQTTLNKADTGNRNHGDNMVEIFKVITRAMEEKDSASPADQLEYAAQLLRQKESGSAQMYTKGLMQAAQEFQGKNVTSGNALQLVQALLGGGEPAPPPPQASDPLGSLLSGLMGGSGQESDASLDAGDLLNAGLAFMSSKGRGESNIDALVDAVVSRTAMGGASLHRAQSSQLVMNTLLEVVGSIAGK